jgi:CelD/BcsL family acetyltransferase involved in cellulose biosynthesis
MSVLNRKRRAFEGAPAVGRAQLIDPLADERWARFVDEAAGANAFHHPAWLELLQRSYGYSIRACCIVDSSGAIRAGIPLALVGGPLRAARLAALPFSDHCAPLTAPQGDAELLAELLEALTALRGELGLAVEVRGPVSAQTPAQVVDRYHLHDISLEPDVDAVVQRFGRRSQILRGVRKAEREGLVVERRTDTAALAEFYDLHVATRRRQGVPTQPKSFILGFEQLFARDLGFVLVVRDGEHAIAAAVFLAFNGTLIYKYGASDPAALGKRPNNLLFLEAIRWGCAAGMHTLDLGRTDIGHESLREFKSSWGAHERELEYHELGGAPRRAAAAESTGGVARHIAPIIRRSPPIVGRMIGAALYRYAG